MSLSNPTNPKEELLSTKEVARLSGLSAFTIRCWTERKNIPHYIIKDRWYFSPTTIYIELTLTRLPLYTDLKQAITDISGGITDLADLAAAYVIEARGRLPRIKLPNGKVYYTSFGVAWALKMRNPLYINPPEAARRLGLQRSTTLRMAVRGELPAIQLLGTNKWAILSSAVAPRPDTSTWPRTSEVADQWRMSQSAVNRLCKKGSLQSIQIGGSQGYYLINPEALPQAPRHPITTTEFANAMGVTNRAIEFWYKRGLVKGSRLGHVLRFSKAEIKRAKSRGLGTRKHQRA